MRLGPASHTAARIGGAASAGGHAQLEKLPLLAPRRAHARDRRRPAAAQAHWPPTGRAPAAVGGGAARTSEAPRSGAGAAGRWRATKRGARAGAGAAGRTAAGRAGRAARADGVAAASAAGQANRNAISLGSVFSCKFLLSPTVLCA